MATSAPDNMMSLPVIDLDIFLKDPTGAEARQEAQNVGHIPHEAPHLQSGHLTRRGLVKGG
jgi:hypothetical protein